MTEPLEDPEIVYEIGSEELIYRQKTKQSQREMAEAPKRGFGYKYRCRKCKAFS